MSRNKNKGRKPRGKGTPDKFLKERTKEAAEKNHPPELVSLPEKKLDKLDSLLEKLKEARTEHSVMRERQFREESQAISKVMTYEAAIKDFGKAVVVELVGHEAFQTWNWNLDTDTGVVKRGKAKSIEKKKSEDLPEEEPKPEETEEADPIPRIAPVEASKDGEPEESPEEDEADDGESEDPGQYEDLSDRELLDVAENCGISVFGKTKEELIQAIIDHDKDE